MRKSALHYLGQRITSEANLKRVLARRAQRKLGPEADVNDMIERTVEFCRRNGLVDDAAFVEARIRSGRNKGHSRRRIGAALGVKGVDRSLIATAFNTDDGEEREERSAARLAQRKHIGPWRRLDRDYDIQKEIATLARGGFSISLARRIVNTSPEEAEDLWG